jgi:hypothetical protein
MQTKYCDFYCKSVQLITNNGTCISQSADLTETTRRQVMHHTNDLLLLRKACELAGRGKGYELDIGNGFSD